MKAARKMAGAGRLTMLAAACMLAACGGGGDGGSAASSGGTSSATASSLSGTVAVGDALVGARVTLLDAKGRTATAISGANGAYTLSLAGMTAPFLLVATDTAGGNATMYSVAASAPASASTPGIVNITPLTTAIAAELTSDGNPLDLSAAGTLSARVTPAAVNGAVGTLNALLAPILASALGSGAAAFNPISQAFTPNQTGADAVIDAVSVTQAPAGGLQIASVAAPAVAIPLSAATTTGPTLAAPAQPANYLATLLAQLTQCLGGTASACASAIDAHYLENGYDSTNGGFQAFHPGIGAPGSTITGVKTLASWAAGQGPFGLANPSALVRIFYTNAAGQQNFAHTVVQQTAAASGSTPATWDIVGNQQAYDITIVSFISQRQYLDSADANTNRFETGIDISIPVSSASVANPANLGSAKVTGPGLPAAGVWLEPRSATGSTTLSLTSRTVTSAPTSAATSSANTTLYRWSWQALPANASSFAFSVGSSSTGYYASPALTAQTLPAPLATYSVTFYDTTGTALNATPVTVVNGTAPLLANAGAGVAWQTIGGDVSGSFLNPAGSLASAQTTVGIDWSGLVSGSDLAPNVKGVQIQAASATTEVDGWWETTPPLAFGPNAGQYSTNVTAGVAQNGQQTCVAACQFPALQSGGSRLVQLGWGADGVSFYNIWKYND